MAAPSFTPDANKHLHVLRQEWENCTACGLGQRRAAATRGGAFVFGEGVTGRIMIIGGGPDKDDDASGRPFSGEGGQFLHKVIKHIGLENQCYFTNTVSCRSCSQDVDSEGQLKTWSNGDPAIKDHDPFGPDYEACRPRLYEEIYIVDPLIIITLGNVATEVVTKVRGSIGGREGEPQTVKIPGAGYTARLTEKKKQWHRKVRGQWVSPVDQNMVDYLCIPTKNPSFVLREGADQREGSPMKLFVRSFERARDIYFKYMSEVGTPE